MLSCTLNCTYILKKHTTFSLKLLNWYSHLYFKIRLLHLKQMQTSVWKCLNYWSQTFGPHCICMLRITPSKMYVWVWHTCLSHADTQFTTSLAVWVITAVSSYSLTPVAPAWRISFHGYPPSSRLSLCVLSLFHTVRFIGKLAGLAPLSFHVSQEGSVCSDVLMRRWWRMTFPWWRIWLF